MAETFAVVQLGVCVFRRDDDDDDMLSATPLSFPIRPGRGTFACQASSIRFLAEQGRFDFNELFRSGLSSEAEGAEVIRLLSASGIPIVMHNALLDICFLMATFRPEGIPSDMASFKEACREMFPILYDSKLICSKNAILRRVVTSCWLEKLFHFVEDDERFAGHPTITRLGTVDDSRHHDAAYDAFMTGVVFARARAFLANPSATADAAGGNDVKEEWIEEDVDWSASDVSLLANRICLNR